MNSKKLLHSMAAAVMLGLHEQFAAVKYGSIITEIKGKVNGHIFQGSGSGPVMKGTPPLVPALETGSKLTKADAGRVMNPLTNTAANATNWRNLTESERGAWAAAAPNFPFKNKFNEPYTGSGYQLYMSVNNNLLAIGAFPVTTPPEVSDIVPTPALSLAAGMSTPTKMQLTASIPSGYTLVMYATSAQSAGRTLIKGRLKAIAILDSATTFPYNITPDYVKVFGVIPSHGFFWFQGKLTKADAGRQSVPYTASFEY